MITVNTLIIFYLINKTKNLKNLKWNYRTWNTQFYFTIAIIYLIFDK